MDELEERAWGIFRTNLTLVELADERLNSKVRESFCFKLIVLKLAVADFIYEVAKTFNKWRF